MEWIEGGGRERERERKGENTELFIGQHVAAEIDRSGAEQAERNKRRRWMDVAAAAGWPVHSSV